MIIEDTKEIKECIDSCHLLIEDFKKINNFFLKYLKENQDIIHIIEYNKELIEYLVHFIYIKNIEIDNLKILTLNTIDISNLNAIKIYIVKLANFNVNNKISSQFLNEIR